MCLRIKDKNYLIAEEDKTVYKVLLKSEDETFTAPCTGFVYSLDAVYKVEDDYFNNVFEADKDVTPLQKVLYEPYPIQSLYGFHTYIEIKDCVATKNWIKLQMYRFNSSRVPVVVKCIIPKGSKYYIGIQDTGIEVTPVMGIVSNKIKPIKIIDTKNGCN